MPMLKLQGKVCTSRKIMVQKEIQFHQFQEQLPLPFLDRFSKGDGFIKVELFFRYSLGTVQCGNDFLLGIYRFNMPNFWIRTTLKYPHYNKILVL